MLDMNASRTARRSPAFRHLFSPLALFSVIVLTLRFWAACLGLSAHRTARALSRAMSGVNWSGCTKSHMCDGFFDLWHEQGEAGVRRFERLCAVEVAS